MHVIQFHNFCHRVCTSGESKSKKTMGCATKFFGFIFLLVVFILGQGQPSLGKSPSTVPSGFKAKTFYRDYSQLSPTHDHFNAMINHSINRLYYFNNALTEEPVSLTHWGSWDYIIELGIGKPPKTYHLNIDTGSHLTWIQHKGCSTCIDKNKQAASYDDKNSTTSIELSCYDVECDEDGSINCDDDSGKCTYKAYYADGSNFTGLLYLDTFTFLSTDESDVVELEGVRLGGAFDCTQGAFHHDIQGVFGLSRNRRSFISQNGFLRFSHCIPSYKGMAEGPPVVRSNMMFGTAALLLGNSTAMTPHLHFYIVTLNGISVRGMRLWLDPSIFRMPNGRGRTIVDTGTPLTYIPEEAFNEVVETLEY
ncbi:hypothetical protein LUZ63_005438 [Rhynchospora breviuscula]|uniref:Peptidase A1 domain-containing protein n=1 Tax=Rhynchospora breviuscula TaxID=2022672 RepID=A0A9P9Z4T8_9POAL|nr:hypothetical protein LUZ63_024339 [Rhynchospora breviuscula]KAJ1681741.1 hypothetical protein LUZ63_023039 [Rhynchospora breviuscula]KAJ1696702.1 hypothetical protein LUZ63_005214 [Rhynchospora breviuscula]KAJ1696926.1 hypothetical protein LUZ63_005438 [Rhynchospora breviuscula]